MNQRFTRALVLFLTVFGFYGIGCTPLESSHQIYKGSYPIKVVCTTGMVADLVHNIGGLHVNISTLMGPGVDPHLYEESQGDSVELQRADIIFFSGRHLEGKMSDTLMRMARRKRSVGVSDCIKVPEERNHDPHVWMDVSLWSHAARIVNEELQNYDPVHAIDYNKNLKKYQKTLNDLHNYARDQIATIPRERRVLITAHDAFEYFGAAYDMDVRGIQGISTESEAATRQISDLVQFIAQKKIKAIFVESSVSRKNIEALVEGCRVDFKHEVIIGGELYSDALGELGSPAETYEGMIRHNVDTIVKALK